MGKRRKNRIGYERLRNSIGNWYWAPIPTVRKPSDAKQMLRRDTKFLPPENTAYEAETWYLWMTEHNLDLDPEHSVLLDKAKRRDYQRERVYKAEETYFAESELISINKAMELIGKVCTAYGYNAPEVWTYNDMGIAGEANNHCVVLDRNPKGTYPKGMVLHEITHSLTFAMEEYQDMHGAVFSNHYLDVVHKFDKDNYHLLETGFEEQNVNLDVDAQIADVEKRANIMINQQALSEAYL